MAQKRNDDLVQLLTPDFIRRNQVIGASSGIIMPTVTKNPKAVAAGDRPAGIKGEVVMYSGKLYFCTNAVTPTWETITSS